VRFCRVKGANAGTPRFGFGEGFGSDRSRRHDTGRGVGALGCLQVVRECIDVLGLRLDVRAPYIDLAQHFNVLGRCIDVSGFGSPRTQQILSGALS